MSELRKPPMLASTRLGDVIIDFANYRLISNKKQSKIEPRVMAVLQVLLDNAGQAVSRDTFIDEVWDGNALSDDALNRTISILRRELRAFGYDGLVKTIPKRGYRLDYPDQTAPGADEAISEDAASEPTKYRAVILGGIVACLVAVIGGAAFWFSAPSNSALAGETDLPYHGEISRVNIRSAFHELQTRGMPTDIAVEALVRTQSYDAAIEELNANRDSVIATLSPQEYIGYLHQLGALAFDRNLELAVSAYRQIVQLSPEDTLALTQLARLYYGNGEMELAQSYITRAEATEFGSERERLAVAMNAAIITQPPLQGRIDALRAVEAEAEALGENEIWARTESFLVNYEWLQASQTDDFQDEDYAAWIARLETVRDAQMALGLQHEVLRTRCQIALMISAAGDRRGAIAEYEEILELEVDLMRPHQMHVILSNLALLHMELDELEDAKMYNDLALRSLRNANLNGELTHNWYLAAQIADASDDRETACSYMSTALQAASPDPGHDYLRNYASELSCQAGG